MPDYLKENYLKEKLDADLRLSEASRTLVYNYLKDKALNTQKSYLYLLGSLTSEFEKDILELTQNELDKFFEAKKSSSSDVTYANHVGFIRKLFAYIEDNSDIRMNDKLSNKVLSSRGYAVKDLYSSMPSDSDLSAVYDKLKEHKHLSAAIALILCFRYGFSTRDACDLKNSQLSVGNSSGRVTVHLDAHGYIKARNIVLDGDIVEDIKEYKKLSGHTEQDDFVLLNKRGGQLIPRNLQYYIHNACIDADIKPFALRQARSSGMVYLLAEDDVSWSDVSRQTGTGDIWSYRYHKAAEKIRKTEEYRKDVAREIFPLVKDGKMTLERAAEISGLSEMQVKRIYQDMIEKFHEKDS